MFRIQTLDNISDDQLHIAREAAFAGYASSWTRAEFDRMLLRRGYRPDLSFGAFDSGKLLSFILNGIGYYNGQLTAYDTGTGTIPEFQGQGLARKLFDAALPVLQNAGIRQYLLEVLTSNAPAIRLYQSLGFVVSRNFNYFIRELSESQPEVTATVSNLRLERVSLSPEAMEQMQAMWDFYPSWQNSFESILREPGNFVCIGALNNGSLCGYGIIEPLSGDIPQFAVKHEMRRQGVGTLIFQALMQACKSAKTKLVNTDAGCTALTAFLQRQGYPLTGTQYEMIRKLA